MTILARCVLIWGVEEFLRKNNVLLTKIHIWLPAFMQKNPEKPDEQVLSKIFDKRHITPAQF